jgi:hypothetical protein
MGVKICFVTGKFIALKTKINTFFLVTFNNAAIGELTGTLPASFTVRFR